MGRQANGDTAGRGNSGSSCATCGQHVLLAERRLASCAEGIALVPESKNPGLNLSAMVVEFPAYTQAAAWCDDTNPILKRDQEKQCRPPPQPSYLHRCKKDDKPRHASPCLPIHRHGYANNVGGCGRKVVLLASSRRGRKHTRSPLDFQQLELLPFLGHLGGKTR